MARLILPLVLLLSAVPVCAQEKESSSITFKITRFDPAGAPPPDFQVRRGAKKVDFKIPLTHIAGPFTATLREGKFLDFFTGKEEEPAISVEITAAERKDLLLVFTPDGESFRVRKIHAPLSILKGGDRYVVNTTDANLSIKLGDAEPVIIEPEKSSVISGAGGEGIKMLAVEIKQQVGEEWRLVSSEEWSSDPRFRKYLFVYQNPRRRSIAIKGVVERL